MGMTNHLERAIAKDLGHYWSRKVGDDRQNNCHPGCDGDDDGNFRVHIMKLNTTECKGAQGLRIKIFQCWNIKWNVT